MLTSPTIYDTDDAAYSDALTTARRGGANHEQAHDFATIYTDAWREAIREPAISLPDPLTAWRRVLR